MVLIKLHFCIVKVTPQKLLKLMGWVNENQIIKNKAANFDE